MIRTVRALPDVFRVSIAEMVAYRAELFIWILTATLPLVMLALWSSVASEGPVAGLDQDDLARYYGATLIVKQMNAIFLIWTFSMQVRTGSLSGRLLKPYNPLLHDATRSLAALPMRLLVLVPLVGGLILWRPSLLTTPDLGALALFLPAMVLAWCLCFMVQACFALLAFWIDKASSLWMVWFAVFAFLSGYVAPLDLFPTWSRPLVDLLPFPAMHALPTELLASMRTPGESLLGFGVGLVWLGVFSLLAGFLWRAGLKRYGAFGG